jgi:hypothetical protein
MDRRSLNITCISPSRCSPIRCAIVPTPVWFTIALEFVWLSILVAIMLLSVAK